MTRSWTAGVAMTNGGSARWRPDGTAGAARFR
jgi:hypothetical protein